MTAKGRSALVGWGPVFHCGTQSSRESEMCSIVGHGSRESEMRCIVYGSTTLTGLPTGENTGAYGEIQVPDGDS